MLRTILLAATLIPGLVSAAPPLKLSSPDVKSWSTIGEKFVLNGFGCAGQNQSPAFSWRNAPEGTKSFALTVYDPDAPTGSGWWHWVVVNIPGNVSSLPSGAGSGGALPAGALQVRTDFGAPGYGGPCPPAGDKPHRYFFTLHALRTEKIELPPDASAALAGFMIHANEIAKTRLVAKYGR